VHDVRVLEAAHHVRDGVAFADIGEELVAQAFALRCAGHEPRDIDELDRGGDDFFLRLAMAASLARRGSGTSTMPIFGSMVQNDSSPPQSPPWSDIEESRLPYVGQPDNSAFSRTSGFSCAA